MLTKNSIWEKNEDEDCWRAALDYVPQTMIGTFFVQWCRTQRAPVGVSHRLLWIKYFLRVEKDEEQLSTLKSEKKKGYNGKQQALNLKRKPIQNEVRSALANNCGYRN